MHKLIIVGHQSSNFQDTFKLLQSYGVNDAKPSRREGYTPLEISKIICQAHGIDDISVSSSLEPNFRQLEVGNVWHGLALDLMLGNMDSKIWGWADTNSIYLLNFWRDIDPEITFVLVYSNPEDVLLQSGQDQNLTLEDLETKIEQWIAYNEALLYFYNRNKDRSFLVHSQQVNEPSKRYLLEIGSKINAPWLAHINNDASENNVQIQESANLQAHVINENYTALVRDETMATNGVHEISTYHAPLKQKPLSLFISRLIIQQHPKLMQLYEDLQSFANFPLYEDVSGINKQNFNQSAFDAWLEMTNYLNQLKQTEAEINAVSQKNVELMSELVRLEEIPKLTQEKDQLFAQLHEVQEQLEQFYIDNKNLNSNVIAQQEKLKELDATKSKLKEVQTELKKLDTLPELEQENSALLSQLHHVQEELERYYLENQAYKEKLNSAPKVLEYSAEQIKAQLAYRLGGLMIKNSKSLRGYILLPVSLLRETRRYKQEKQAKPKYEKRSLSEYEKNQVAIVKTHLSYRLGSTLLANIRNPFKWPTLPYKLWREISQYKKMRS